MNVGIIGAGNMGSIHAGLLRRNKDIDKIYILDFSREKAVKLADEINGCVVDSIEEINKWIDMVFIAVPNTRHAQLSLYFLNEGKNVFCEKPMSTSLDDAKKVVDSVRKSGKRYFVGFNKKFSPAYSSIKKTIIEQSLKPVSMDLIQNDGDMMISPWLTDLSLIGGFLYDSTVHFFDLARFYMGDVENIRAFNAKASYKINDNYSIQMKFKNGSYGVITSCGHATWAKPLERVQIMGSHVNIVAEDASTVRFTPGLNHATKIDDFSLLNELEKQGYIQMHEAIFDSIRSGKEIINGPEEGYRAIELIDACERSASAGGSIINL